MSGEYNGTHNSKPVKRFFPKEHRAAIIVVFVIFCMYAVTLLFPIGWLLVESFNTKQSFATDPTKFANGITLENYKLVFTDQKYTYNGQNVFAMFINNVIVAFGTTFATIASACMASYVVSRYRFRGGTAIYTIAVFVLIIPTTGSIATTYRLMNDTGLAGTHVGVMIKGATAFGMPFLMLYAFFRNLSATYTEAAQLDGAGHFTIFLKIMVPLALPSIMAIAIVTFIGSWNDYITPYLYLQEYPTLSLGLYMLRSRLNGASANPPAYFAMMIVSVIPILILFSCFQKQIIKNTVAGGIKG